MFECRGGRSIKPGAARGGSSAIPPAGASAKGPVVDLAISRAGICSTSVLPLAISNGGLMVREVKLRQVGGSVGATLPKDMADRLNLAVGDRVLAVETEDGILLSPYDPTVEKALALAARTARKYRNALRQLAR